MPTKALSKPVLNTLLHDAQQQHQKLAQEFGDVQTRLARMEPGTDAFTLLAHKAADLKGQLQTLTGRIQELELQTTTEEQRKAQAELEAAAAQAQAELEAQAAKDLAKVEVLIKTINGHSDGLAAAITELTSLDGWGRLGRTGQLRLDTSNRSTGRVVGVIPYIARRGTVARLRKRNEAGLR